MQLVGLNMFKYKCYICNASCDLGQSTAYLTRLAPWLRIASWSEQLLSFILLPLSTCHSRYERWNYLWSLELPFLELLVVALLWTCALVHSRADSGEHSALWAAGRAARSWLHSPQRPHHGGDQVSPSGWGSTCKTSLPCVFFFFYVGCVLARHLSDITLGACCWDYLNCLLWRRLVYCVKRLPTYVKLAVGLYSFETVCSENCNIVQSLPAGDISVQSLASCCTSQRCPAVNSKCLSQRYLSRDSWHDMPAFWVLRAELGIQSLCKRLSLLWFFCSRTGRDLPTHIFLKKV